MTKQPRALIDPAVLTSIRAILEDTQGLRDADAQLTDLERSALRESVVRLEAGDWQYLNRLGPLINLDGRGVTPAVVQLYREDHPDLILPAVKQLARLLADQHDVVKDELGVLREAERRIEAGDRGLIDAYAAVLGEDPDVQIAKLTQALANLTSHPEAGKTGAHFMRPDDIAAIEDVGGKPAFVYHDADEHTPARKPILPALLPELRAHLRSMWEPRAPFNVTADSMNTGPVRDTARLIRWETTALENASLWWVSAEMVDVLLAAAATVPDDVRGHDLLPLDIYGLVALQKPWLGTSSTDGDTKVQVDAFLWGPTRLPPLDDRPDWPPGEGSPAVSLSAYSCFPPASGIAPGPLTRWTLEDVLWAPLGRSDWPLGDDVARAPWAMSEQGRLSFAEDRKILCALMTLLAHEGIAEQRVAVPQRGVRRRLDREHGKRDHSFRIVTLRTLRDDNDHEPSDSEGPAHDHRWIVTGHWRRQPYGPQRSLRRLQWISPYVKGPEGTPLEIKETIHAWRR